MHHSSGRAYTTPSGSRTVPWYNLPTPLGVPQTSATYCTGPTTIAPNKQGEAYKPIIPCYNPDDAGFWRKLYNWGMGIWYGENYPPRHMGD